MNWKKIARFRDTQNIPVQEDDTPFVRLDNSIFILQYEKKDMVNKLGGEMYVRKTVAEKLLLARNALKSHNPKFEFRVVYAYRTPEIQEKYFNQRLAEVKNKFPELSINKKRELAHSMSAHPTSAGHPTGGALDLTIWDTKNKRGVDMGSGIAEFGDVAYTFYPRLSKTQKENRLLLNCLMTEQGFAPFLGEWWHFSYGDKEWAFYYKKSSAIYGPVLLETIEKSGIVNP